MGQNDMLKSWSRRKALIVVGLLGATAGAVGGSSAFRAVSEAYASGAIASPSEATSRGTVKKAPVGDHSLADMVGRVGPAVVQIEVSGGGRASRSDADPFGGDLPDFYGNEQESGGARNALGSGFVISPDGIVVTNNHVVENGNAITVKLSDGREFPGRLLGRDPKTDLAVVKIEGGDRFEAIAWGDSDQMRVGNSVFAVGSPFGLGNTVTSGIISARGREIGAGPYDDFLQVDAAINSGNSGGPLFNADGQVVGVNTAIFSPSGGNVGIGFAIPSRIAQSVVGQILKNGQVSRGRIGVALQPLTPQIAQQLGVASGALIADVEQGSPAEQAGLRRGDVVTSFDGRAISDSRALARAVASTRPGATLSAQIIRDGRTAEVSLRIEQMVEG